MSERTSYLEMKLQERKAQNAFRVLSTDKEHLIDFCSNDYLGLARSEQLAKYADQYYQKLKFNGSTGSRLISGNSVFAEELEREVADFHQGDSGLIFNSGYAANLGLLSCIASRHDTIIYDELVHASIRDGIRLSASKSFSFKHNDLASLEKKANLAHGRVFVVVESIYSMDGDAAPLEKLVELGNRLGFCLIVDEAHALGVFGKKGEGLVVEMGLQKFVWARVCTFGKALGAHGAMVIGSASLKSFLINFSRPFIYTTALSPHSLATIKAGYDCLMETTNIYLLKQRIRLFKSLLNKNVEKYFIPSASAIQSLVYPGNKAVKKLAGLLQNQGFDVRPILHPTVAKGKERLRICIHAFNSEEQVKSLVGLINNCIEKNGNE